MHSCLRILKKNSAKESYVYNNLLLDLHEITFAGFLFTYATNTVCRIHGRAEWGGGVWFIAFMTRGPDVTLRKAENLSYDRLMGFNTEMVDDCFKLSKQTMDAMKLAQGTHLIYNLDETGLQLTCSSGNQKGSKTVPTATHGRGNRDSSGLHGCSKWKQLIPPVVLYKGKYWREDSGDALSARSNFSITPKGYITTEGFCKFLHHFNHHWLPGTALLILDGHRAYVDPSVLIEAKKLNIQLLCLPAHCSLEL
jgi:hypothetical protein